MNNIKLDVNLLIDKVIELTKDYQQAKSEVHALTQKVSELEAKLSEIKLAEQKANIEFEQDLEDMAKQHSLEKFENLMSNIVNG